MSRTTATPSRRRTSPLLEQPARSKRWKTIGSCVFTAVYLVLCVLVIFGVGRTPKVDASAVELDIRTSVSAGNADCPGSLRGTVGSTLDCTVTGAGAPFVVRATVTSVDGDEVFYDLHRVS